MPEILRETLEVTCETIVTDNIETVDTALEERKRLIAYQLWEDAGRPEGQADAHWEKACLVVMSLGEGESPMAPEWLKRVEEFEVATPPAVAESTELRPEIESIRKRIAARVAA